MKKIFVFLFLLLFPTMSFAIVDTTKVSINEAVEIAQKNNLDIQSSRKNIDIEKNSIQIAKRFQNPEVGVFYSLGKAGKGDPQQIGFNQIVEVAKRGVRKNLAESRYELASKGVEYLEIDLKMDVREAYTNLLARKSILKTMQSQEELLKKMLEVAKEKDLKTAKVQEIDVLQAQLLLNQIITEVTSARYNVKTALYEFNKVINCPDGFYDTKEESFTSDFHPFEIPKVDAVMPDFEKISTDAINNRADIKIALQAIDVAEKNLIVEMRKKVPDLELTAGYSYQNWSRTEDHSFQHGSFLGAKLVNIPLFYSFEPEIKNARIQLEQAHLNYASVENKAMNDLKKAYEKFLMAQSNLKTYNEQLLTSSEELIRASRKSYKADKIDLTTLITMEESYRMVVIAHTNALADYYNAWNSFIREVNNEQFIIKEDV